MRIAAVLLVLFLSVAGPTTAFAMKPITGFGPFSLGMTVEEAEAADPGLAFNAQHGNLLDAHYASPIGGRVRPAVLGLFFDAGRLQEVIVLWNSLAFNGPNDVVNSITETWQSMVAAYGAAPDDGGEHPQSVYSSNGDYYTGSGSPFPYGCVSTAGCDRDTANSTVGDAAEVFERDGWVVLRLGHNSYMNRPVAPQNPGVR